MRACRQRQQWLIPCSGRRFTPRDGVPSLMLFICIQSQRPFLMHINTSQAAEKCFPLNVIRHQPYLQYTYQRHMYLVLTASTLHVVHVYAYTIWQELNWRQSVVLDANPCARAKTKHRRARAKSEMRPAPVHGAPLPSATPLPNPSYIPAPFSRPSHATLRPSRYHQLDKPLLYHSP